MISHSGGGHWPVPKAVFPVTFVHVAVRLGAGTCTTPFAVSVPVKEFNESARLRTSAYIGKGTVACYRLARALMGCFGPRAIYIYSDKGDVGAPHQCP